MADRNEGFDIKNAASSIRIDLWSGYGKLAGKNLFGA
jgi:hypothetical protein